MKPSQSDPKVYISPRALQRIKQAAILHPNSETGEALIGLMPQTERRQDFPTMYILETIAASRDAVREWAMFEQGDEWQFDVFKWLNENWEVYRELRRRSYGQAGAQWDLPLRNLGDWHKQPGMVAPSMGDYRTAKQLMKTADLEYLLTPIVTFADEADLPAASNTLLCEDVRPVVRLDFWGISRKGREFIPLEPIVALGYGLPRLPEVVWWLDDEARMTAEIAALERAGVSLLDVAQHNADGLPPLETCFTLAPPNSKNYLIAVTPHTYPKKAPHWRIAPPMRIDDNERWLAMYQTSKAIPKAATEGWTGDQHALIDGLRMIQTYLKASAK